METRFFFIRHGADAPHQCLRASQCLDAMLVHSFISTQTCRRALTASVDRCPEIIMHSHSEHRFPAPSSTLRAPLSGIFLHTPSIAFRHLPPHSEHRFPAPSSTLCPNWLHIERALFISAQLSTAVLSKTRLFYRLSLIK